MPDRITARDIREAMRRLRERVDDLDERQLQDCADILEDMAPVAPPLEAEEGSLK